MKQLIKFITLAIVFTVELNAQDSLTLVQLKPITYTFDVKKGKLIGNGKLFLEDELSKAQFTMICEYHGSKRISEFTNAIIPILDKQNYKAMALEVGPTIGQVLNDFKSDVAENIKSIHNKYLKKESDDYVNTSFPFFDNIEDAKFLQTAKDKSWTIFGIDQEYYDSYVMLADMMYSNLSKKEQKANDELYMKTIVKLKKFYSDDINDVENFHFALAKSELYKTFTQKMATEPINIEIIEAMTKSSEIYLLNHQKQWFENNATRITYMKSRLNKGLSNLNFNIAEDKLLIKMGGYHLSKGFSPLGLYEVGNTLNEIAEYHGNTALNIGFMTRFHMEDNVIIDNYESENKYYKNLKDLLQMGKKDEWIVIDLRPLIKGHFYYPKTYNFNKNIEDLVKRYDLLVIPKTEVKPTPNHD